MRYTSPLVVTLLLAQLPSLHAADRQNILIALANDMSSVHTSAAGCKGFSTPNIDRLAKRGVMPRNGYRGIRECSPFRAAFFTGRDLWMNKEVVQSMGASTIVRAMIASSFPNCIEPVRETFFVSLPV